MTTYIAINLAAWGLGFVLGWQVRMILRARYAA